LVLAVCYPQEAARTEYLFDLSLVYNIDLSHFPFLPKSAFTPQKKGPPRF
jgi:hypothetical protein